MNGFRSPFDAKDISPLLDQALRVWEGHESFGEAAATNVFAVEKHDDTLFRSDLGTLRLTLPGVDLQRFQRWLGRRLVWMPRDVPQKRNISIVSSRIGERPDLTPDWFDALRTAIIRLDRKTECLCVVSGTAIDEILIRAAMLFGIPFFKVAFAEGTVADVDQLRDWLTSIPFAEDPNQPACAHVSPAVLPASESSTSVPVADRASTLMGDRLIALSVRTKGNVESSLLRRLEENQPGTLFLLRNQSLTKEETFQRLVDSHAVPWILTSASGSSASVEQKDPETDIASATHDPISNPNNWLCHWTRARPGPWPDETQDDFLDALILGCDSADRSAFAATMRIAETGRLHPSPLSRACVSFTAVPLKDFTKRRTYRRHLRRYDFEPWGVAIRRSALSGLGIRPVRYVEASNETDEWDVQQRFDRTGRIDWSLEQEWRVPTEIDLTSLSLSDVIFFVATDEEARKLTKLTDWAVVRVPSPGAGENRQKKGK